MDRSKSNGIDRFLDKREQEQWERFGWSKSSPDTAPMTPYRHSTAAAPSNMFVHSPTVDDLLKVKGESLITVAPSESIAVAAEIMSTRRIGLLLVSENQRTIIGILSERDLVKAVADMPIRPIEHLKVSDLMITNVITCSPEDLLITVLDEMRTRKFRHMPVARNQQICAMVSITDVLTHLKDHIALHDEECMWLRLMSAL
jgi:CBS domain-containing protein